MRLMTLDILVNIFNYKQTAQSINGFIVDCYKKNIELNINNRNERVTEDYLSTELKNYYISCTENNLEAMNLMKNSNFILIAQYILKQVYLVQMGEYNIKDGELHDYTQNTNYPIKQDNYLEINKLKILQNTFSEIGKQLLTYSNENVLNGFYKPFDEVVVQWEDTKGILRDKITQDESVSDDVRKFKRILRLMQNLNIDYVNTLENGVEVYHFLYHTYIEYNRYEFFLKKIYEDKKILNEKKYSSKHKLKVTDMYIEYNVLKTMQFFDTVRLDQLDKYFFSLSRDIYAIEDEKTYLNLVRILMLGKRISLYNELPISPPPPLSYHN